MKANKISQDTALLALEGDRTTIKKLPIQTIIYPNEEKDYNPDVSDFLGFSVKKTVKKAKKKAKKVVKKTTAPVKAKIEEVKTVIADKTAAIQEIKNDIELTADMAKAQLETLKENTVDNVQAQLDEQIAKVKEQYAGQVMELMKNPQFQNAAIMVATTALGQPQTGLAIIAVKTALEKGDYSAVAAYAAEQGGMSAEDIQWAQETYALSQKMVIDNQELIKANALDVSKLSPGENIPGDLIVRTDASGVPSDSPLKNGSNKTLLIAGAIAAAGILYFISRR